MHQVSFYYSFADILHEIHSPGVAVQSKGRCHDMLASIDAKHIIAIAVLVNCTQNLLHHATLLPS